MDTCRDPEKTQQRNVDEQVTGTPRLNQHCQRREQNREKYLAAVSGTHSYESDLKIAQRKLVLRQLLRQSLRKLIVVSDVSRMQCSFHCSRAKQLALLGFRIERSL